MRQRLLVAALALACGGCAGIHRDLASKACRELQNPTCPGELQPVVADCRAGDRASCALACRLDSTEKNCQSPCDHGDANSCYGLAAALSDGQLPSPHPLRSDPVRAAALLAKACGGGVGEACFDRAYLALTERLSRLSDADLAELFGKACAKGDPTACFVGAARAFNAGNPAEQLVVSLQSGCTASDSSRSTPETRLAACQLDRCLRASSATGDERARRDACASADGHFAFDLPWASVGQPRLTQRMPWMLDAMGGSVLAALPRGTGWYCFSDSSTGVSLCQRSRGECLDARRGALEKAAAGATVGACDRGPPVAACFRSPTGAICVDERATKCIEVRRRLGQSVPAVLDAPCISVGELF